MDNTKRIKELNDLIDKNYYLDTMDIYGVRRFKYQSILKREDFILLISLSKEENKEALNVLLKYYYQVVINFSLKYSSDFLDKEDLVEAGLIGFLEAVKSYDIEKGTNFKTWLYEYVRKEILLEIAHHDKMMKIDQNMVIKLSKIRKFMEEEKERTGKLPDISLLEENFKMKREALVNLLSLGGVSSLDDDTLKEEVLRVNTYDDYDKGEIRKILRDYLSIDEYQVFSLIYGLDKERLSYGSIAKRMNVSKSMVQFYLKRGIERIKSSSAYLLLKEYYYKDYISPSYSKDVKTLNKKF